MNPQHLVLSLWQRWGGFAFGRWCYSRCLGWLVPYSGSISANVLQLKPGYALVSLRDRRAVRNHLHSIHALALANLGELSSGLAMMAALPNNIKAIVTKLEVTYLKKARGQVHAEGFANPPTHIVEPTEHIVSAAIKDDGGDVVATLQIVWQLKPEEVVP
ncbi:MAG: hypothetical protein AUK35_05975 [Zetaproteobacteria bacterium CG2_30_46_52]|nr:MAG: hypothetical protein AUK35_05975 [Zetaproteobacteria bacterium CG2_30_46_52]